MPITKSAKKALRQNEKRRKANFKKRKNLKSLLKEIKGFVSEKKTEEAKSLLPKVYKVLDKAAKQGLIKKTTAGRRKSRISKMVNKKL